MKGEYFGGKISSINKDGGERNNSALELAWYSVIPFWNIDLLVKDDSRGCCSDYSGFQGHLV